MNPQDWREQCRVMVDSQLRPRDIHDSRVLDAMSRVPRHLFVSEKQRPYAYEDRPLPIGEDQTISQPYMVALMTQLLEAKPTDIALEIGTGSAYQAAVLSLLVKHVYSIERVPVLAEAAKTRLYDLGYTNVTVLCADGTKGHPDAAPYDCIIVTAGGPCVPTALEAQLALGGRLVCPVGPRDAQELCIIRRTGSGLQRGTDTRCSFVPLIGAEGWPT